MQRSIYKYGRPSLYLLNADSLWYQFRYERSAKMRPHVSASLYDQSRLSDQEWPTDPRSFTFEVLNWLAKNVQNVSLRVGASLVKMDLARLLQISFHPKKYYSLTTTPVGVLISCTVYAFVSVFRQCTFSYEIYRLAPLLRRRLEMLMREKVIRAQHLRWPLVVPLISCNALFFWNNHAHNY